MPQSAVLRGLGSLRAVDDLPGEPGEPGRPPLEGAPEPFCSPREQLVEGRGQDEEARVAGLLRLSPPPRGVDGTKRRRAGSTDGGRRGGLRQDPLAGADDGIPDVCAPGPVGVAGIRVANDGDAAGSQDSRSSRSAASTSRTRALLSRRLVERLAGNGNSSILACSTGCACLELARARRRPSPRRVDTAYGPTALGERGDIDPRPCLRRGPLRAPSPTSARTASIRDRNA